MNRDRRPCWQVRPFRRRASVEGVPAEDHASLGAHGHESESGAQSSNHLLHVEESSVAALTSTLKHLPSAAVTGGAASMANVVFGVSIIGLLAFQATRTTVAKCLPPRKLELVPSPLLPESSQSRDATDEQTECSQ